MIAAAGSGERLGAGGPKALVEVAGRPLLDWSLAAAAAARSVTAIVVAAPPGAEAAAEAAARAAAPGELAAVVPGGETRAESVRAAVAQAETELVVVHDAARPLASAALFDAVCARLERSSAAAVIAACPIRDTVKRARPSGEDSSVAETLAREQLWAAQTPQAFDRRALIAAQRAADEAGELASATDEARMVERAGGTVLLEEAPAHNIKVTTREDLLVAEALLAALGRV